ncbi:Thiamin ABC transporter, substrate-binding component [hydrothermal vent metagenome]|uniref:Thiamine-binding periplasmic protein n=1 Tax=hydrothermal vent metagenome TaxID=652676 RepID=A0A3B0TQW4_9ZZZZ
MFRKSILAFILSLLLVPVALAEEKPTLTIYTYDAFAADWGPAPALTAGFEETCDCIVNWVAAASSIEMLRLAQLGGDAAKADIILGLDTSILAEAEKSNLFVAHNVDTSALKVPNNWRSDDFVPFDYGYFAFIYNKEKLANPPRSFEQMASSERNLKIIIQDPRSSTPGLGLMLWVRAAFGNDANEAWAEIAPRVLTMTRSWSESYNLFLKGEADMVLSYTTSPAYHLIAENDDRYKAAKFREGQYLQIEVAGILKASDNKPLARKFLAYLISPAAQTIIPTSNWMYPVADIPLPKGFETLIKPKRVLLLEAADVAKNRAAWIKQMLAAFK